MASGSEPLLGDSEDVRPQGFGMGMLLGYLSKYGGRVFVAQGDRYIIDETTDETAQLDYTEPPRAVSVLEMLYVPYLASMTIDSTCNVQVYPLFVTVQLGLSQSYIGFIEVFSGLFDLLLNSTSYNDRIAKNLDWWDAQWVSCLGCALSSFMIAWSPSGNFWAICICIAASCIVRSLTPPTPFSTFRRRWCDREDDSVGASLQVGCRYLSVAVGVQVGITVARLSALSFRGVFVFATVANLILGGWSHWASRAANPKAQRPRVSDPLRAAASGGKATEESQATKWSVLYGNMDAAVTVLSFSIFTDITRSTWPRTLTYVANNSPHISHETSAHINSGCHLISLIGIVLTPLIVDGGFARVSADKSGLHVAATLSFFFLTIAHGLLSQASSHVFFVCSGIAFGLGEAFSCGLRENVRMTVRRAMESQNRGDTYIKIFDNGVYVLEGIVKMAINFSIPVFGDPRWFGMQKVSLVLCGVAAVATLFSTRLEGTRKARTRGEPPKKRHPDTVKVVHCPCF